MSKTLWGGGGTTSDKYLTDNSGTLKKLLPGDLVRADRQFTIQEILMLHKPELAIPAFTKAKDQMDPVDVEQTCGIANIRVHMERVIGLLRRKFTIQEFYQLISCSVTLLVPKRLKFL